jgi:uncharacterized protein YdaU (DUF1376 family)
MAADLCYYRCYPKDYLGSPIISRMTLEEQGAHQRLMAHGWRMDGIPADRREIATLLGLEPGSERAERIITRVLDLAWKPDTDNPRTLRNDEQEAQRQQSQAAYRRQCESIAKARAKNAKNAKLAENAPKELTPDLNSDLNSDLKTELQSINPVIQKETRKDIPSATRAEMKTTVAPPIPPSTRTADKPPPGKPRSSKATPEGGRPNWVDEGVTAWVADIGFITHKQFGGQMKGVVDYYGWEKVFPWLKAYIRLRPYMIFGRFYGDDPKDYDKPKPTRNLHGVSLADFIKTITIWEGLCQPIEHPRPTRSSAN